MDSFISDRSKLFTNTVEEFDLSGPRNPVSIKVLREKYMEPGEDWWSMTGRVAGALHDDEEHRKSLLRQIRRQEAVQGGRILTGAGSTLKVTLMNCYTAPRIEDSLCGPNSIMDVAAKAAKTMQKGGGIGFNFGTLRPKGALIKSLGSESSGPVSFMTIFDAVCGTIASAGGRRGAMMATMPVWHPDIEEFIGCKANTDKLTGFNISVLATNDFMKAVKEGLEFNLTFQGQVYKTVDARALWDAIMRMTWKHAEPGILFIDRMNEMNNLRGIEEITSTNPCVPANTPILTSEGYVDIGSVVDKTVMVWNGVEFSEVTPRKTGENQPMVKVHLADGSVLRCTRSHIFVTKDGERVEAANIVPGTKLIKSQWPVIEHGEDDAELDYYAQGFFSGDGHVKGQDKNGLDKQYIALYGLKKDIPHPWKFFSRNTHSIMGGFEGTNLEAEKDVMYFPRGSFYKKDFVPSGATLTARKLWLAGLVDSDGTVTHDSCIQIGSKDRDFLYRVKLMLNTMGATGHLSTMGNTGNGRAGKSQIWRLSISATHANVLDLPTYRIKVHERGFTKARFPQVLYVEPDGIEEEVFCFTEHNRNMGVFNGVLTGQCSEIPLPYNGCCLLGSINLTKFVKWSGSNRYFDWDAFRAAIPVFYKSLDNVVDVSHYPLPEQELEEKNKRRIGIGTMGNANAFEALGIPYGSEGYIEMQDRVYEVMVNDLYQESSKRASERGSFPLFDRDRFLDSRFVQSVLSDETKACIEKNGMRNSHLTAIAPTGSISIYADNISSGIEPVFLHSYERDIRGPGGRMETVVVQDYGVSHFGVYGRTANEISAEDHVYVAAAAQKWMDQSVSKTCNVGKHVSWADFKNLYMMAYDLGAKGITTYREGNREGVLREIKEGVACTIDPLTGAKTCS